MHCHKSHAASILELAQGCAEIRWLADKMGAKPTTVSGLSGLGDIMLTCYGALSRNRSVGIRLGQGEALQDILDSSSQVGQPLHYPPSPAPCTTSRQYDACCVPQLPSRAAVPVLLGGSLPSHTSSATALQVAEGVTTAAAVVGLGRKYRVALPVLTAVAQVMPSSTTIVKS